MAASISGNVGQAGAIITWSGTAGGRATSDSQGNYLTSPLAPGTYELVASLAGYAFNPSQQIVIVAAVNIVGVNFQAVSQSTPASGFDCSFIAQNSAGLNVYVGPGQIMGTNVNGQVVALPPNAETYIWVDNEGNVLTGAELPPSVYAIALVTSGQLQTSGSGLTSAGCYITSNGILSIQDIRNT
jgi:hypothetical protein